METTKNLQGHELTGVIMEAMNDYDFKSRKMQTIFWGIITCFGLDEKN